MSTKRAIKRKNQRFVVCLTNEGYEISLEPKKLYAVVDDPDAEKHGDIRVIDESGEDYLFPATYFAAIELPAVARKVVLAAS